MPKKLSVIPLAMTVLLIIYPSVSMKGAAMGLGVWAENVIPTLFPFMAVSAMLINCGVLAGFAGACSPLAAKAGLPPESAQTIVAGMISGYPVGAGMTAMMNKQNKIERNEVCFIAAVSSFCSPMFIIGTVGAKMLRNGTAGAIILAAHYLSLIATVIIFRKFYNFNSGALRRKEASRATEPFGKLLKISVENAVKTILTVGGYIVLFSIIVEFITSSGILPDNEHIKCIVAAFLEMSNGCASIAYSALPLSAKIASLCFCTTWGGLCIILQICGFISECGASCKPLVIFKLIQASISALLGFIFISLFVPREALTAAAVDVEAYAVISTLTICLFLVFVCVIIPVLCKLNKK